MPIVFPGRIIDSVNGLVGKVRIAVVRAVTFNVDTPYLLEFKDQDENEITSLPIGIENIKDLEFTLEGKQDNLSSSDESLFIDQELNDIKINVEGWDLAADFNNQTPNI